MPLVGTYKLNAGIDTLVDIKKSIGMCHISGR